MRENTFWPVFVSEKTATPRVSDHSPFLVPGREKRHPENAGGSPAWNPTSE